MAQSLNIVILSGSVRENNCGSRVIKFMKTNVEKAGHHVEVLDADELDLPLLKKPVYSYDKEQDVPLKLREVKKKLDAADAFVVIAGEYNNSAQPGLTNMMDYFPVATYSFKPSAIVCYSKGHFGGVRAAMQLRCFLGEIGCIAVQRVFAIPKVHESIGPEGEMLNDKLAVGAKRVLDQLCWFGHATKNHRDNSGVPEISTGQGE